MGCQAGALLTSVNRKKYGIVTSMRLVNKLELLRKNEFSGTRTESHA
jgi:hypothetical protein